MMLLTGLEKLAELEKQGSLEGGRHYVLCNGISGRDITYNMNDQTFSDGDHLLTQEDVDKDDQDIWCLFEIKKVNGIEMRRCVFID